MITEEFKPYSEMFENVVDITPVELTIKPVHLKVDNAFLKGFIKHISRNSLVEPPYYLISESQFLKIFEKYYIKTMNVKKEVTFDSTYKAYLNILMSKIKILQIEFSDHKKNFVYSIDLKGEASN